MVCALRVFLMQAVALTLTLSFTLPQAVALTFSQAITLTVSQAVSFALPQALALTFSQAVTVAQRKSAQSATAVRRRLQCLSTADMHECVCQASVLFRPSTLMQHAI